MRKVKEGRQIDKEAFVRLCKTIDDWKDIDWMFNGAVGFGVFLPAFLAKVFEKAGKEELRNLIKRTKFTDDDSASPEYDYLVSINMLDKDTGRMRPVYRRISTFDLGDYIQASVCRVDMTRQTAKMILRYTNRAAALFGEQVRGLFPDVKHILDDLVDDQGDDDRMIFV